ncbi:MULTISPECIES: hypothetical protein [unclassified Mesorhizobium]|uniref:hypothetical protein n=1 Tax=unclassified Mesorhizobium TaxID=325217 RepID=UPI001093B4E4|nr:MULTISPECIES: hypothetical protein [unclassified Mesorhizobium]TGT90893.1 hypothetical protein EN804_06030 [Mesorhizobium sp. M8A.F.Ca.ET.161.01.1.1]TGV43827.1 hypothetical protein EN785_07515 [Mesorhizobium sp. M8A.F.Ca.ET.142.01.1.1]TGW07203.1 hypothetical protein EN788_38045 [Mesorhizobium sp. M2D.F.Ca.ET.145.01.1.1]
MKRVRITLLVTVSDDHDDAMPTIAEVGAHVCREVNAAKGQYPLESWQHEVAATVERVNLVRDT